MDTLLDVLKVKVRSGYVLELEFENGELRVFDMSSYMDKKPFNRLRGSPAFNGAHVDYGTVVWPGISTSHRKRFTTAPSQSNPFLECGGDKGSQQDDITRAKAYWADWKRRSL